MSMIPDEVIEQVRDGADLLSVIGETVELKRTGSDYRGPCPFHGGMHRNFAVIPKKGRYYCFVCKESGDVFSWYMKRLGMDYPTAVREVARKVGIVIPEATQRQGPDPREPLFQAVSVAHDWFARQLRETPEADDARKYLVSRGFDLETLEPYQLGFAPRGTQFSQAMAQLGLAEPVLLEAGLLARREDGSMIPRFRGRLLFPIHDLRGRAVGFGGRLLGPGEPKYLNSPETPIFKKGQTLYNLHNARNPIRKEGSVIVVEGYFDVLRLLLAGCEHVVAPLGTALTGDQAALLKRYAPVAVLLLDSDMAGLKATFRAADEMLRHEMRVKVATMPAGEDPDTLLQKGGLPALETILRDAVDVMERKIQILDRRGWFSGIEHRREALDRLLPTIRATKDPIQRELYLSLVAERSGVDRDVLAHEVAKGDARERTVEKTTRIVEPNSRALTSPTKRRDVASPERKLLELMVSDGQWRAKAKATVSPGWFRSAPFREIFMSISSLSEPGPAQIDPSVSDTAQRWWQRFLDPHELQAGINQDAEFAGACVAMEQRFDRERIDNLSRQIESATDADRSALITQKATLRRELTKKYPGEANREAFGQLRQKPDRQQQ